MIMYISGYVCRSVWWWRRKEDSKTSPRLYQHDKEAAASLAGPRCSARLTNVEIWNYFPVTDWKRAPCPEIRLQQYSGISPLSATYCKLREYLDIPLRERSQMTSAAEEGGFKMLTVADKGGRGSKPCWRQQKCLNFGKKNSNQACLSLCVRLLH